MAKKKEESSKEPKESIFDKKWVSVLAIVIDVLIIGFCSIGLTIMLYLSDQEIAMDTAMTIFSIDWTVFGIFIGIAGLMIALKQKKRTKKLDLFDKTGLLVLIINSFISAVMLMVTTFFAFTNLEKQFIAASFSSLYLLSAVFILYIVSLASFVLDESLVE